jgi:septal ring factor EnvC (AmiA/AmiB activator)
MSKIFYGFLISFALGSFLFATDNIEKTQQELEAIKKQLEAVEKTIQKLSQEEKDILKKIEAFNEKINLTRRLIKKLSAIEKSKTEEIKSMELKIEATKKKISQQKMNLDKLLVVHYKLKCLLPLERIISEKSYGKIYQKFIYLRILAANQKNSIIKLSHLKEQLENQKSELIKVKNELGLLKTQREKEQENLIVSQTAQKKLLSKVNKEKEQKKQLAEELKVAVEQLERLIKELEAKRRARKLAPGLHYLEVMKGKLPWPCTGEVVGYFGTFEDSRYKTKLKNNGIDIKCRSETPVKAIAPGKVVFASRFMGYGNMVILDHGEGYYTVYANLSEIKCYVDSKVEPGEILGYIQDILHFELRSEGKAVDPLLWLAR